MKIPLIIACVFSFGLLHASQSLQPLTEAEADAIILAEETAKAQKAAARLAKANAVTALSEGSYVNDNGDTIIVRQIEAPEPVSAQPDTPAVDVEAAASADPSTAGQATGFRQSQVKAQRTFQLSATIYESASHLRWQHEGQSYEAWTPVNWKHLSGIHSIESEAAGYFVLLGVGPASIHHSGQIPDLSEVPATGYLLTKGDPNNEAAFDALEALFDYYEAKAEQLHVLTQRREALAAARKRYKAAHPEQPKTLVFNYFERESSN